jgi:hypothetical protein
MSNTLPFSTPSPDLQFRPDIPLGVALGCGDELPLPPLPVVPEGWGEGDLVRRAPLVLGITLTLSLSRSTGRGDQRPPNMNSKHCPFF